MERLFDCRERDNKKAKTSVKESIHEAALTLFAERGFHAVSLRDISSLVGCNVSAINYHFTSKEELYKTCLYQNWNSFIYIVEQSLHDVSSYNEFCDKIRLVIYQAVDSIVDNPRKSQLVIREMYDFSKPMKNGRLLGFTKTTSLLANFIKLAQDKGIIKKILEPHFAASFILSSCFLQGVAFFLKNSENDKDSFTVQMTEQISLILFQGVS